MNLENAPVYDVEAFPNVFTLHAELLNSEINSTWEISEFRNDIQSLMEWFEYLARTGTPMIGFNSQNYDYSVIHYIMKNPNATPFDIYKYSDGIIKSNNQFSNIIWPNERIIPQIDLFKIQHFDNVAKTTSLKALQINMRSEKVVDMPVPFGTILTKEQIDNLLIPYNKHDVTETKKFAWYCMPAIEFRIGLMNQIEGDVLNFNDTKIGAKILEQRLGEEICYDRSSGRKQKRQTIRNQIALNEIIFDYIYFENQEFQRILTWMKQQVLTSKDITPENKEVRIETKGVFKGVIAHVGGIDFHFGTGGIHGSISQQKIIATDEYLIRDIDVTSLYPSIAVVNRLRPEHLGELFVHEFANLLTERKQHKKGTVENASLKLAANGTYGNSNNPHSVFYDTKLTLAITINGQLMLCMLAEQLLKIPTLQLIQINTDGVTYKIHKSYEPQAKQVCENWEKYTCLNLEDVDYSRMWIRDVNNYIAEDTDGKLKQKGAYWHPDLNNYADSISKNSPPAWHKDFNPVVVTRAAVAHMTTGIDLETFIKLQHDPFDFMCRIKVPKDCQLMLGNTEIQGTSRYYVAINGEELKKVSPPKEGCEIGQYKRANKLTDAYFNQVMQEIGPNVWDERIHTKNKSTYQTRINSINVGWLVAECNIASDFDFNNLNYDFYIAEAQKLIIN